jgi:hypothetical protein
LYDEFEQGDTMAAGEIPNFDPESDGVAPVLNIESAEGVTTFQGFTDETEPQAVEWLDRRFEEMEGESDPRNLRITVDDPEGGYELGYDQEAATERAKQVLSDVLEEQKQRKSQGQEPLPPAA